MSRFNPTFHMNSPRNEYGDLLAWILRHGEHVAPRNQPTTEVTDALVVVHDPTDCNFSGIGRSWNSNLAALDILQLAGGFSAPAHVAKLAPNTKQFLDHGIFRGAYGPRIYSQLPAVLDKLRSDQDTRQAILQIWDPAWDLHGASADYPCTIFLQLTIRKGKLILHTYMRSNDAWWGWAYDAPMFINFAASVADALGLELGPYYHHATSLHIYERDRESIEKLFVPERSALRLTGVRAAGQTDIQTRAREVYAGVAPQMSPCEKWLYLHGGVE